MSFTSLPSLSKTWCTRRNIPFPDTSSVENIIDSAWFLLKCCLMDQVTTGTLSGTRHANSIWSIVQASNGTTFNTTDLWGTVFNGANFVHNNTGSNHSHCIVRNTNLGRDLLMSLNVSTIANGRLAMTKSSTPFTGGSLIADPAVNAESFMLNSATDSTSSSASWCAETVTGGSMYAHFSCDEEGNFFFCFNRAAMGFMQGGVAVLKTTDNNVNDTRNVFFFGGASAYSGGANRGWPDWAQVRATNGVSGRPAIGSVGTNSAGVMSPWVGSAHLAEQNAIVDAYESKVRFFELDIWDSGASNPNVYRGKIIDVYGVIGGGVGVSYPSVAAQQYIQVGGILMPFVGGVPNW